MAERGEVARRAHHQRDAASSTARARSAGSRMMVVAEGVRGEGIGAALVAEAEKRARGEGLRPGRGHQQREAPARPRFLRTAGLRAHQLPVRQGAPGLIPASGTSLFIALRRRKQQRDVQLSRNDECAGTLAPAERGEAHGILDDGLDSHAARGGGRHHPGRRSGADPGDARRRQCRDRGQVDGRSGARHPAGHRRRMPDRGCGLSYDAGSPASSRPRASRRPRSSSAAWSGPRYGRARPAAPGDRRPRRPEQVRDRMGQGPRQRRRRARPGRSAGGGDARGARIRLRPASTPGSDFAISRR